MTLQEFTSTWVGFWAFLVMVSASGIVAIAGGLGIWAGLLTLMCWCLGIKTK